MTSWQLDKKWSDRFLPEIKSIVGKHLIGAAPDDEDAQHNTDLIVLRLEAIRIACRIRTPNYYPTFAGEFTIRSDRPSGVKTELCKIVEGWGDFLFYGFSDATETQLQAWLLGDLKVFRRWHSSQLIQHEGRQPGQAQTNKDGSSSFRAFRLCDLPSSFVIARHPLTVPTQPRLFIRGREVGTGALQGVQ